MESTAQRVIDLSEENQQLKARIAALETALTQAQQNVSGTEETNYQSVVMALNSGVVLQTADGIIQIANASAERILGLSGDQLRGRTSLDPRWHCIHEDGTPFPGETHPAMVTLQTGEPCIDVMMGVHTPDDRLTWIIITTQPLFRPNEALPYAVITSFTDISERVRAEKALQASERRFSQIFHSSPIGVCMVSAATGLVVDVNPSCEQIMGYSKAQIAGNVLRDLGIFPPSAADAEAKALLQSQGSLQHWGASIRRADGLRRDLFVSVEQMYLDDQDCILIFFYDITEMRQTERQREALISELNETIQRKEALYRLIALLNNSDQLSEILHAVATSAVKILPAHLVVLLTIDIEAQEVLQQIIAGSGASTFIGGAFTFTEIMEGLSGIAIRDNIPVLSLGGVRDERESLRVQERRIRANIGSILVVPIRNKGTVLGTITALNATDQADFTIGDMDLLATLANQAAIAIERATLLSELQQLATYDGLTMILNRRAWLDQARRLVAIARRSLRPISLIIFDIDHFKHVNDRYGHDIGDRALQLISGLCQQQLRVGDVFGRYGGEEFVILLPDTDGDSAFAVAERLRVVLAAHNIVINEQRKLTITISVGIATMQGEHCDLDMLLRHADKELYAAKDAGRNVVRSVGVL
jgi:diguanylate cyclase (GGDEF)-like protein/PAS domain S-box-containing protein